MRAAFSRVRKGTTAVPAAACPAGTNGGQLDALARQYLWKEGLDFDHGTGHGVGSFLGVHEGPQRISATSRVPIEAGMIISNEPGYYRSEEHTSELQSLMRISYAVFFLKKKTKLKNTTQTNTNK